MSFQFDDFRAGFSYFIDSEEKLLKLWSGELPWLTSPLRAAVYRGQPDAKYWTRSRFARHFLQSYPDPLGMQVLRDEADIKNLAQATSQLPAAYLEERTSVINSFLSKNPGFEGAELSHATLAALAQHYGYYTDYLDCTFDVRVALYFAFDFVKPPDSGFVSVLVTTPWAMAGALIQSATQNNFLDPEELRPHVVTDGESSSIAFPHPDRIGRNINARLQAQKACVICYPGLLPYEVLMHRQYWSFNYRENRILLLPAEFQGCVSKLLVRSGITRDSLLLSEEYAQYS